MNVYTVRYNSNDGPGSLKFAARSLEEAVKYFKDAYPFDITMVERVISDVPRKENK
jgi:hypothetical protein